MLTGGKQNMKIYARTLNPEDYDYRMYDIEEDDGNEVIIDGGRDFSSVDQKGYLKDIKKLIDEYYFLESYYNNSIMSYLRDYLPKKENGKKLSPKEASWIKQALDYEKHDEEIICECLSIITGKIWRHRGLRGCCQGDYVEAYYPCVNGITTYLDYVEAWYFGTGTEVEVSEEDASSPEEVSGWRFYTANWRTEDIKAEIKSQCGYKEDDKVEVVLWLYDSSYRVRHDNYKLAD